MNFWLRITHIPRNFDNMPVMSQIDRLTAPADPLHETAGGTRSILIEGLKDIVAEEGELNALRYHLFIGRGAQRQIELEPRPLRHVTDLLGGAVRIDRQQDFSRTVRLRQQLLVGAIRELRKGALCGCHHVAPMPIAIAADGIFGEAQTEVQLQIVKNRLFDLNPQRGAPLDQVGDLCAAGNTAEVPLGIGSGHGGGGHPLFREVEIGI